MSYRPLTLFSTGPTGFNLGNGIISQDQNRAAKDKGDKKVFLAKVAIL